MTDPHKQRDPMEGFNPIGGFQMYPITESFVAPDGREPIWQHNSERVTIDIYEYPEADCYYVRAAGRWFWVSRTELREPNLLGDALVRMMNEEGK